MRCISWKTRRKSKDGEEISQENASGINRVMLNMKPCHDFMNLEQNFAPNSQGCQCLYVHPTCF